MAFNYPYGDTQQLNLNWFLAQWETFREQWATAEEGIDHALDAEIARVEAAMTDLYAARDAAAASKTAAQTAATNAASSETVATQQATLAQSYANTAQTQAGIATAAAEAAGNSASSASTSATAANLSKTQAANSATAAAGSASDAADSATAAAGSATAAAGSATAAAGSASSAADSATAAAASAASIVVDSAMSDSSTNPVQNKVINGEITELKTALTYNTADGDIVWFNDAQEAPVANISVDNEATILNRLGTNLVYIRNFFSGNAYGITSAENADGSYHLSGEVTNTTWIYFSRYINLTDLGLKVGMTLTISLNNTAQSANFAVWFVDSNSNRIGAIETQYTSDNTASAVIPEGTIRLRVLLYPQGGLHAPSTGTTIDITLFPQIEIGSTATPFQRGERKQYTISNGTPVEQVTTLEGKNSFWADAGNVSVKYLLDVKKYVDNKIAEIQATMLENIGG